MEKSRSWSSAHDWKSCNRQKRFESSNLSFSATSKSLDIKGKPFCIKAFLCFYVTRSFSNNNVFLRILVCFTWSMSHVSSSLSIGLFSVSLMNLYVNSVICLNCPDGKRKLFYKHFQESHGILGCMFLKPVCKSYTGTFILRFVRGGFLPFISEPRPMRLAAYTIPLKLRAFHGAIFKLL